MNYEQHVHDWIDDGWLAFAGKLDFDKERVASRVAYYKWVESDDV